MYSLGNNGQQKSTRMLPSLSEGHRSQRGGQGPSYCFAGGNNFGTAIYSTVPHFQIGYTTYCTPYQPPHCQAASGGNFMNPNRFWSQYNQYRNYNISNNRGANFYYYPQQQYFSSMPAGQNQRSDKHPPINYPKKYPPFGYHQNNGYNNNTEMNPRQPQKHPAAMNKKNYRPGVTEANEQNHKTDGFINGIKNIVNHFINPKMSCDLNQVNNHRLYNSKCKLRDVNRDKELSDFIKFEKGHVLGDRASLSTTATETVKVPSAAVDNNNIHLKTVFLDLSDDDDHKEGSKRRPTCNNTCRKNDTEIVAIFTSKDFPPLPQPKKLPSPPKNLTVATSNASSQSCLPKKLASCSFFINFDSGRSPETKPKILHSRKLSTTSVNSAAAEFKSSSCPVRQRQISECDSEDSFIVFSNEIPSQDNNEQMALSAATRPQRQRQLSECSDDSFVICFTDDADDGLTQILSDSDDDTSTDDDDDDDDLSSVRTDDTVDDCDDSTDSEKDEIFEEMKNKAQKQRFPCKNTENSAVTTDTSAYSKSSPGHSKREEQNNQKFCMQIADTFDQIDSGFDEVDKVKKVRFDPKPKVHLMRTWAFAQRESRHGPWEEIARDRVRFKQRCDDISKILDPVLNSGHRQKIYNARFCDKNKDNRIEINKSSVSNNVNNISTMSSSSNNNFRLIVASKEKQE